MPAVFVHGNPETSAIWGPLLAELGRTDTICLSPPGFGAPVPDGFGATRVEYGEWLVAELEAIGGEIDLVGHDWGGGHVMYVAMNRPELLRSWATDVLGLFAPDYVWHDMAQAWQTPDVGEQVVAGMSVAPLEDRVARFVGLGIPDAVARSMAPALDATMAGCILALYRSAAQPAISNLYAELPNAAARPGLAILASDDPYMGPPESSRAAAAAAGATVAALSGVGHWWMLQDPAAGAKALNDFWAGLS